MSETAEINKSKMYDLGVYYEGHKRTIIIGIRGNEIEAILKRFREVEKYSLFNSDPMQAKRNEYQDNSMRHGTFIGRYEYNTNRKMI